MDPLSVTASIIAVLQLTKKTTSYLIDIRGAPEECQSCTIELSGLETSLISLKHRAERVEQAQSSDPWFEQLRILNVADGPLDQYHQALELLLSKVDTGTGLGKVQKRLLWHFEKKQVTSIQARIERLKSLITTALLMDHIALSEAIKADISSVQMSLLHVQADVSTLQTTAYSIQNDTQNIRDTAHSIKDDMRNIRGAQDREQYRSVLEWLSSTDYPAQQQSILSRRQEGTAQWFVDSAEFRQWLQGPKKTLFCPGIPGAGKTMMAAVAIDHLSRTYGTADVGIAYVFCSYKAQVEQSVSSLLAAIVKQLAPSSSEAVTLLTELYDKYTKRGARPAIDELLQVIRMCVSYFTTYIVVDALDEFSSRHGARDRLIETLLNLQARGNVRLLFTSRFIPEVTSKFCSDPQLEVRASEQDVRRYLEGQTSSLPRCVQRDEALRKEVQNTIVEAVDGMFLLASLHLRSICEQTNRKEVRVTLTGLTSESGALDAAYKGALTRIDGQPPKRRYLAQRALYWISYAERQLTTQELRIALAIEPGETALDVENLDDIDDIVSFCAGLVTVDYETSVVRLVHYTTQEYLQRVQSRWASDMQHTIAKACLSYLSFEEFRSGACTSDGYTSDGYASDGYNSNAALEARLHQYQFFDYAARYWSHHVRPVERYFIESAAKIAREDGLRESITQVVFTSDSRNGGHRHRGHIGGCGYPQGFTALHMMARSGLHGLVQHWLECEANANADNVDEMDSDHQTPLHYASENGHMQVVKLLLDKGAHVNAQGGEFGTALYIASEGGHEQVVKLLLDEGADVDARGRFYGTALFAASVGGHEQVVKLLLDKGAHVNAGGGYPGTVLCVASGRGHEQVVKLLLDMGADVNARGGLFGTALYTASERGHEQVVKVLLDKGAHVNAQYGFDTALCAASALGHEQVVKLLLDKDTDVNAQGGEFGTALCAASAGGHEQVVKLLLDKGADVNAQDGKYGTALGAALTGGREQIVKLLVDKGAHINAQDGDYDTALYAASAYGREQVVKLLLDKGTDVNAQGGEFGTALRAASARGHEQVVKLLLDKGAHVNAQGGEFRTALCAASSGGHEQIVQLLVDKGAHVNAQDRDYGTALGAASAGGHEQVVKLLIDKGVDVNAEGGEFGTALRVASAYGREQIVKLLVDKGAHVNAQDGDYGTALQAASAYGREQVVKLLLDKGADVNAQGGEFGTALRAASAGGHEQVVKLLLDKGAHVSAQNGDYSTALGAASHGRRE